MSDQPPAPAPLSVFALRALGRDYLLRENANMEEARRGRGGGYTPLPVSAAEYAGALLVQSDSARAALAQIAYDLRHLDACENGALWREAYALLAAAVGAPTSPDGGTG